MKTQGELLAQRAAYEHWTPDILRMVCDKLGAEWLAEPADEVAFWERPALGWLA